MNEKTAKADTGPDKKPIVTEIPDVATQPHPTGPLDIPGFELPSGFDPSDPPDDRTTANDDAENQTTTGEEQQQSQADH